MKKSLLILPFVLIAAALALAGCGGGGSSSSGGGEETAIEEAIETAATSSSPSKCTELQTEEFDGQESGVSGPEATELCEEGAEGGEVTAESVDVSNISVNGETATAEAEFQGSALNGQTVEVELADEGGNWKLNQVLGFTNYDAQALSAAFEEELEGEEGMSAAELKCLVEGTGELSQEEAEEISFEGSTEAIEELAESCQ